jgi:glycine/D-amino acid oxidase-like deaminating enzyme
VNGFDVAIIGGGIIGTASAVYLAEAGASVVLVERTEVGAGASGRNSGALQHPYDPILAELQRASLPLYRDLAAAEPGFALGDEPAGLLLVSTDTAAVKRAATELAGSTPELAPSFFAQATAIEPALAPGTSACRLATGYAVAPAAATSAFARRAQRAGADLRQELSGTVIVERGRAVGVRGSRGETIAADSVLVAAGPWTPGLVPGWAERPPIQRTWGVVVSIKLASPPRQILEQVDIDAGGASDAIAFSLVTAGGVSSLGSTWLRDEPDPSALVEPLREHGRRFVPALAEAPLLGVRACARPVSFDGRPLIGPVPDVEGLFVCAGHGPWGMSTGPGSARLVAGIILRESGVILPAELNAARWTRDGPRAECSEAAAPTATGTRPGRSRIW